MTRKPQPAESAAPPPVAKKYLAVMRFKDLSGDPNGQLVVDGFAETLTARLAHFPTLQVMRPPAADPGTERSAQDGEGPRRESRAHRLDDARRRPHPRDVHRPRSQTGREWRDLRRRERDRTSSACRTTSRTAWRAISTSARATRAVALDPAVSQRRYLEALGHLRRYDNDESLDAAIEILEELGDSPSVQAALARAYLYKFQITQQPQLAAAAGKAAERALAGRSAEPRREHHSRRAAPADGPLQGSDRRVRARAVAAAEQRRRRARPRGDVQSRRAISRTRKRSTSARSRCSRTTGVATTSSARSITRRSRYEDAIPQFQKVMHLVPDNERGYNNLGGDVPASRPL